MVVAFVLALAQTVAIPQMKATTPAECVKEISDHAATRQRQLRSTLPASPTAEQLAAANQALNDLMRELTAARPAMAKQCAAQFDVKTIAETELASLAELYGIAGEKELAKAALDRALANKSLPETARATVLVQAVRAGLNEPKGPERNARIEKLVEELDRMSPAVIEQKITAHNAMNNYYRFDDIDAGIIKHSTWLIETGKTLTPDLRKKFGSSIVGGIDNLAEAWAGQNMNDKAIALLRNALTEWSDLPNAKARLEPTLERCLLVGTPAAAIEAPRWLNVPPTTKSLPMTGHVTLLEFTAHWCGPCKESYPGLKRMLAKYGAQGFRVVLATELWGYFEKEQNLTPDVEFERDRAYFKKEGMDVPIAIAERPAPKTVDGKRVPIPEPNSAAYKVGGIPQIHLIDKQGRIRLFMVGYDDANEPKLAKMVEELLKEK